MAHPEVGNRVSFKSYETGQILHGTVDWVGSAQFSVEPDSEEDPRELIMFSNQNWVIEKAKKS